MLSCITEFNEEAFIKGIREEALLDIAKNLLDVLSDEEISKRLNLSLEVVEQIRKENE